MSEHIGDMLSGYMDDELDEGQRKIVETHLENCPECKNKLLEFTLLSEWIDDAYQTVDAPELIENAVMAQIQQTSVKLNSRMLNRAAIVAVFAFGFMILAAASPFFKFGLHIFYSLYSIFVGLMYAVTAIVAAIPNMGVLISLFIILIVALALITIRYLVNSIGKTVGAEDI